MQQYGIIRREDGVEFVLKERLGSGLLSIAYLGVSMTENKSYSVAKVPFPNLAPDQRERFEEEFFVLTRLAECLADPLPVPHAWWGDDLSTKMKVLMLEYAPPKLFDQARKIEDDLDREKLALRAAVQYAQLLKALHTLGRMDGGIGYTCADRKPGDLRWDDGIERLVVLDWNVVRPKSEASVRDDIYLFGSLWYQLLADQYAQDDPQVLDDRLWHDGRITMGMRYLLASALAANPNRRYNSANELADAVQSWAKAEDGGQPAKLYDEGQKALRRAQQADSESRRSLELIRQGRGPGAQQIPTLDLSAERAALVYLDLALRKDHEAAKGELETASKLVSQQGERLIAGVAQAFDLTQYETGNQFQEWAERALDEAEESATYDLKLRLRLRRWQLLVRAGQLAVQHGAELRPHRRSLALAVEELERATRNEPGQQLEEDWQGPQHRIEQVLQQLRAQQAGYPVASLLEWIVREPHAQVCLILAKEREGQGDYAEAAENVKQADELLTVEEGISQAASDYLTTLRCTLPDLSSWRRSLLFRARRASIVDRLKKDLTAGSLAGDAVSTWYALWRLDEAHRFFADDPAQLDELEAMLNPDATRMLSEITRFQAEEKWLESAKVACNLLQRFSDDNIKSQVTKYLYQVCKQVRTLKGLGNPDSDNKALLLLRQLKIAKQLLSR